VAARHKKLFNKFKKTLRVFEFLSGEKEIVKLKFSSHFFRLFFQEQALFQGLRSAFKSESVKNVTSQLRNVLSFKICKTRVSQSINNPI
jgi:hypothetical protein